MAKYFAVIEIEVEDDDKWVARHRVEALTSAINTLIRDEVSQITLGATLNDAHASLGYVPEEES